MTYFFLQVKDELYLYDLDGKRLTRLAEDFVGAIQVSARRDQSWLFATMSGFTTPCTVALSSSIRILDICWLHFFRSCLLCSRLLTPSSYAAMCPPAAEEPGAMSIPASVPHTNGASNDSPSARDMDAYLRMQSSPSTARAG